MKPSERIREIADADPEADRSCGVAIVSGEHVMRYLDEQDEAASAQLSRMVAELKSKPSGGGSAVSPSISFEVERELRGWALYTGCEGDSPSFYGFFSRKEDADALAVMRDVNGDPLCFDPCVVPAVLTEHGLVAANDFEIETHAQLEKAIRQVPPEAWEDP